MENFGFIPELSGTDEDQEIIEAWESGFGDLNQKVDDYLAQNKPLRGIKIIYGNLESYKWIVNGCEFLSACLDEREVEHTLEVIRADIAYHRR